MGQSVVWRCVYYSSPKNKLDHLKKLFLTKMCNFCPKRLLVTWIFFKNEWSAVFSGRVIQIRTVQTSTKSEKRTKFKTRRILNSSLPKYLRNKKLTIFLQHSDTQEDNGAYKLDFRQDKSRMPIHKWASYNKTRSTN